MEPVTLQFATNRELWNFRIEIESNVFEINLRDRTITCDCNDEHIKLAVEKYSAKVITRNSDMVSS